MTSKKQTDRGKLESALETAMNHFGHRANFTGADIGYRWTAGKETDEIVVRVHVRNKLPLSELSESEILPKEIDGVPLDVIQGDYRTVEASQRRTRRRQRSSTVMGGLSVGRRNGGAGTIGLMVIDQHSGRPGILSNWHVLAGARARAGDDIVHPGPTDGGRPNRDSVAQLDRWMLDRGGDAAVALLYPGKAWLPIQYGSNLVVTGARRSRLGEILVKSGRTTGQTAAKVDGEGIYRVRYETRPGIEEPRDIAGFKLVPRKQGNPEDEEISSLGDSGSVWIEAKSQTAVGLHFAGETSADPLAEEAIACNIETVLERLDVRIARFDDLPLDEDGAELAGTRGGEYIPHEDGPIWPYPWPPVWPRPLPPRFGPYPYPWPGTDPWPFDPFPIDPRVIDLDRRFEAMAGFAAEGMRSRQAQLSMIFGILKAEIEAAGINTTKITRLTYIYRENLIGDPIPTLVKVINQSKEFKRLGLPRITRNDFRRAATYNDVCMTILELLRDEEN